MILTNYATKTEVTAKNNKTVDGFWPIGIDYGFSGVKGFAPNKFFCYPNCAIKMDSFAGILQTSKNDIFLKDKEGCWIIGETAASMMTPEDTMNYEDEMYGRNRYFSAIFRALMKVGIGIALSGNHVAAYRGETIMIQTGLPPKYKDLDTKKLKKAIAGSYDFELQVGERGFTHYRFEIKEENVLVMDQPMGSLISTITTNDGMQCADGIQILRSNTLVLDPGFKTFDVFDISTGMFKGANTFDNLGMHEIFGRTVSQLKKEHGAEISIAGMQKALKQGYVPVFEWETMDSAQFDFKDLLLYHTETVCDEAIQKLLTIYNYLQGHSYMIITGGTGNAWFSRIEFRFRNMSTLQILSANRNDTTLSNTYSNVRGYYLYLVGMLMQNSRRR